MIGLVQEGIGDDTGQDLAEVNQSKCCYSPLVEKA